MSRTEEEGNGHLMVLRDWGWNDQLQTEFESKAIVHTTPGRVVTHSHHLYHVVTGHGSNWSRVTGALRNRLTTLSEFPTVGDWVAVEVTPKDSHWRVHTVLTRRSAFSRKIAGRVTEEQIIAANIDYLFIVNGLDGGRNFNLRGVERYTTGAWESGAVPVILLNKADLSDDAEAAVVSAEAVAPGVAVHATSCMTGLGIEQLDGYLQPGITVARVGRSGVGKSSIINVLLGDAVQTVRESRSGDLRGRHTTTRRELLRLPSGAMLIDTPGLRELQLWGEESTLEASFADVEEFAQTCRFRDCSHEGEPGCAVQQALLEGLLKGERFEAYLDHQRELRHLQAKHDIRMRMKAQARNRAIAKFSRARKKSQTP